MPVRRVVWQVALLSGALAGLAGAVEVAGRAGYVTLDMSPGYGYSGIVVAMLAALNPLGVVFAADLRRRHAGRRRRHEPRGRRADLHRRRDRRGVADRGAGRDDDDPLARRAGADMFAETLDLLFSAPFWVAVLRIATPLILGTLGVLLCERAGVLNLGIEGIMVAGAFAGWLTVYAGGGLWLGVAVAALTGMAFGAAARAAHGRPGAEPARVGSGHHAAGHQPGELRLPRELSQGRQPADDPAVQRHDRLAADSGAERADAADLAGAAAGAGCWPGC